MVDAARAHRGFCLCGHRLVTAFKAIHISRVVAFIGVLCAALQFAHHNHEFGSPLWLAESMKTAQSELKGNPYAGLAKTSAP